LTDYNVEAFIYVYKQNSTYNPIFIQLITPLLFQYRVFNSTITYYGMGVIGIDGPYYFGNLIKLTNKYTNVSYHNTILSQVPVTIESIVVQLYTTPVINYN
jgi:hypothetical protein